MHYTGGVQQHAAHFRSGLHCQTVEPGGRVCRSVALDCTVRLWSLEGEYESM